VFGDELVMEVEAAVEMASCFWRADAELIAADKALQVDTGAALACLLRSLDC